MLPSNSLTVSLSKYQTNVVLEANEIVTIIVGYESKGVVMYGIIYSTAKSSCLFHWDT